MKKERSTELVLPNHSVSLKKEQERLLNYKRFALSFSYPDGEFFEIFPEALPQKQKLISEYDRLFRIREIWLYSTEYLAKHEFQRANYLADIMGFYKAFGVEPDRERPDALSMELEFMHYLIYKIIYACEKNLKDKEEKVSICYDAQKKFFKEYLYPGAKIIVEKIISTPIKGFYREQAEDLLAFLEEEKRYLQ